MGCPVTTAHPELAPADLTLAVQRDALVAEAERITLDAATMAALPKGELWLSPVPELSASGLVPTAGQPWSTYHQRLISVMGEHGIVDPYNALNAAVYTGLNLSIVCTSLLMESWGGKNMWGGDSGGHALPWQWFEHPVTYSMWVVYWANVQRGLTTNGCGPDQLTSKGLQEAANSIGGCWLPGPNMKIGAVFMKQLINAAGSVQLAFQHYNGSGPAAVAYGYHAAALEAQIHAACVAVR